MKYSLLVPTRDRLTLSTRGIESIHRCTLEKNEIEILYITDEDDNISIEYVNNFIKKYGDLDIKLFTRTRTDAINKDYYNYLGSFAKGDLIWIFADDLEITINEWDKKVWEKYQDFKKDKKDNVMSIGVLDNTKAPSSRLPKFPCFPMFTKEARDLFGWLLHPAPKNWGVDYINYVIYNKANRLCMIYDDNYINHISHHTHQVKPDATAVRIGNIFNQTKMIYSHNTDRILAEECPRLTEKILNHIKNFK